MNRTGYTIAVLSFSATSVLGQTMSSPEPTQANQSGTLQMDVQGATSDSTKRVSVSVQRDGMAQPLSGAADVVGFPIIDGGQWGNVDWKVNGSSITGTVVNGDGAVEGTYAGTITATGVSGRFTHADGRVGLWSWHGPPPAAATSDGQ